VEKGAPQQAIVAQVIAAERPSLLKEGALGVRALSQSMLVSRLTLQCFQDVNEAFLKAASGNLDALLAGAQGLLLLNPSAFKARAQQLLAEGDTGASLESHARVLEWLRTQDEAAAQAFKDKCHVRFPHADCFAPAKPSPAVAAAGKLAA
jgi:hypothetical protein